MREKGVSKEGADLADRMVNEAMKAAQPEKIKQFSVVTAILNLVTFLGAVLMFRLNRKGFWLYVAGTAALVAAPFVIYGTGNFLSVSMALVMGLIGLVFVLMYAKNLKYMH